MRSFELSENLDLKLDGYGNIAIFDDRESLAQDAACAIRTFFGEVKYYSYFGIKYQQQLMGRNISLVELQHLIENEITKQSNVTDVVCILSKMPSPREVGGVVFVTDSNKNKVEVLI